MTQWRISNRNSGQDLGVYEGQTADDAWRACARDAGEPDAVRSEDIVIINYSRKDPDAKITCHRCGANLNLCQSVSRLYVSKDEEHEDSRCLGHYDHKTGDFEPDTKPSVPLEHHDLLDNSDECNQCGAVVG